MDRGFGATERGFWATFRFSPEFGKIDLDEIVEFLRSFLDLVVMEVVKVNANTLRLKFSGTEYPPTRHGNQRKVLRDALEGGSLIHERLDLDSVTLGNVRYGRSVVDDEDSERFYVERREGKRLRRRYLDTDCDTQFEWLYYEMNPVSLQQESPPVNLEVVQ